MICMTRDHSESHDKRLLDWVRCCPQIARARVEPFSFVDTKIWMTTIYPWTMNRHHPTQRLRVLLQSTPTIMWSSPHASQLPPNLVGIRYMVRGEDLDVLLNVSRCCTHFQTIDQVHIPGHTSSCSKSIRSVNFWQHSADLPTSSTTMLSAHPWYATGNVRIYFSHLRMSPPRTPPQM